jgi:hypothetical protein
MVVTTMVGKAAARVRVAAMAAVNAAMVTAAVMAATAELRAMSLAMRRWWWWCWQCGWQQQQWLP